MIDWDNLTQNEYDALCAKRRKIEVDVNHLIREFEKDSGLVVDNLHRYYLGEKAYFQLLIPQRILFFARDGTQITGSIPSGDYVNADMDEE